MEAKISVVMSVYKENTVQLKRSIYSILEQTFWDFEFLIILDDPENLEAHDYILKIQKRDKRIIFLKNWINKWLPYSLNKAVQIWKWDYIVRMDADDYSYNTRIERQYEYFLNNPKTDLLFTWWREIDEKGCNLIRLPKAKYFSNIKKYFFTKSIILHPTMMCKRQILIDNPYPVVWRPEDFILFIRLIHKQYSFHIVWEVLFDYTIQNYDYDVKYMKLKWYTENYIPYLFSQVPNFYLNIYFHIYILRIIFEYLMTRNKSLFIYWYMNIYKILKKNWNEK